MLRFSFAGQASGNQAVLAFRFCLFLCFCLTQALHAQVPMEHPAAFTAEPMGEEQPRYQRARVYGTSALQLTAMGIGADHGIHKPTYVENVFAETELQRLSGLGYAVEILVDDVAAFSAQRAREAFAGTAKGQWPVVPTAGDPAAQLRADADDFVVPADFTPGSMGGFYTLEEVYAKLDSLHARHPELVSARMPTGSLLTHEGRTQYMVKISDNVSVDEAEPNVLYTALQHAREPNGMMSVVFYMQWLMENYGTDPRATYVVDRCQLYFVPVANPDGYAYNQATNPGGGGMWRKNRSSNAGGSRGVDLNRNWPFEWGYDNLGSSGSGFSDVFRGSGPASEPEIANLVALSTERNFRMALNYHSFGNYLIQPWGYANVLNADQSLFTKAQNRMTADNGYLAGTSFATVGYAANGVSDDWFYGEQMLKDKTFAWSPEVGTWFWPSPAEIAPQAQGNVLQNLLLGLYAVRYEASLPGAAPLATAEEESAELPAARLTGETQTHADLAHTDRSHADSSPLAAVGTPVPHPVHTQMRIPVQWHADLGSATIRIYNLTGGLVAEQQWHPGGASGAFSGMLEMDASGWPEGHYHFALVPQGKGLQDQGPQQGGAGQRARARDAVGAGHSPAGASLQGHFVVVR